VSSRQVRARLLRRFEKAELGVPRDHELRLLEEYLQLLARWNSAINLTALSVDPPSDDALDRLIVEPIAAVPHLFGEVRDWIDVGSGGGSPAVPMKIASPVTRLLMVESRARKAAFLRELIRVLELPNATVENERLETLTGGSLPTADLLTVRGVRMDSMLATSARKLLKQQGRLAIFCPEAPQAPLIGFTHVETVPLLQGQRSHVAIYQPAFHVEQSR
jgi:16S rRNA (guanine527-N7)-methyltransferase